MRTTLLYLLLFGSLISTSCNSKGGKDLLVSEDFQKALQEKLINAQNGDVIELPEGTFQLSKTL